MTRRDLAFILLLCSLCPVAVPGAARALSLDAVESADMPEPEDKASRESEVYDRGSRSLDDGEWGDAEKEFRKVAEMAGSRADGATYWIAYSLNKQGRSDAALEILRAFAGKFPKSSWRKEARALELEIRPASGGAVLREDGNDEDLKLMAINSLMNSEPERAIPMLEKVLNGSASPPPRVASRARTSRRKPSTTSASSGARATPSCSRRSTTLPPPTTSRRRFSTPSWCRGTRSGCWPRRAERRAPPSDPPRSTSSA